MRVALSVIGARDPQDSPVGVLLRAVQTVSEADADTVSPMAAVRTRLTRTVPAIQGHALLIQQAAQRDIARHLRAAFPDELDEVGAGALVGAMTGAVSGALYALLEDPETAEALARTPAAPARPDPERGPGRTPALGAGSLTAGAATQVSAPWQPPESADYLRPGDTSSSRRWTGSATPSRT
ncbi:hypothetical protein ACFO9E_13190 [Streptomyces maoxianensis]|uniref:Uncharacterized protein n=1 Tax=Streptomyces maoxianensis TaxID=1459942 RepID=A0ABV9G6G8_9ACTN